MFNDNPRFWLALLYSEKQPAKRFMNHEVGWQITIQERSSHGPKKEWRREMRRKSVLFLFFILIACTLAAVTIPSLQNLGGTLVWQRFNNSSVANYFTLPVEKNQPKPYIIMTGFFIPANGLFRASSENSVNGAVLPEGSKYFIVDKFTIPSRITTGVER